MRTLNVKIPPYVYTDQFLRFLKHFANKFRAQKGFGRWLAEYQRMDTNGLFSPEKLKEQYIDILYNKYKYGFICKQAVLYICINAEDATKAMLSKASYEIRLITGEIAVNDDDEELTDLQLEEAKLICQSMNDEAEELLFRVFNSVTNKCVF